MASTPDDAGSSERPSRSLRVEGSAVDGEQLDASITAAAQQSGASLPAPPTAGPTAAETSVRAVTAAGNARTPGTASPARPPIGPRAATTFLPPASGIELAAQIAQRRGTRSNISTQLAQDQDSVDSQNDSFSSSSGPPSDADEAAAAASNASCPRSPGVASTTGSSAGFIYPMRSAVSLKPAVARAPPSQSSEAGSASRDFIIEDSPSGPPMRRVATAERRAAGQGSANSDASFRHLAHRGEGSQNEDQQSLADSSSTPFRDFEPRGAEEREAAAEDREQERLENLTQARFKYVPTADGHMVVTGRDGELTRCEDEPIHIPGAVQSFGCMIVLREDEDGNLVVRQASENTGDILGLSPAYLFKLSTFLDCLDDDQADVLWDTIEALDQTQQDLTESGPHVIQLRGWGQPGPGTGRARARRHWECWCAVHQPKLNATSNERPLTVLEFEHVDDDVNPLINRTPPASPAPSVAGESASGMPAPRTASASASAPSSSGGTQMRGSVQRTDSTTGSDNLSASNSGAGTSVGVPSPRPSVATAESSNDTAKMASTASMGSLSTRLPRGGLEGEPYVPSAEQLLESTLSTSRPLKSLGRLRNGTEETEASNGRRPRPRKPTAGAAPGFGGGSRSDSARMLDMFGLLSQANEQLTAQTELAGFLKVVVSLMREITEFGRVMVYQFDEAWNGQVVCELVDWEETHDLYRGLHFPATDIPKQARDLYLINKVRLLYDRDQSSARMVCREQADLETPVDMTHSFLRAMSPIHVKYLANMGVRASMSVSIVAFDQLWGLIALHSYGSRGQRVSFPMRQLCRLLGESVSRNIERLSYTRRLSARKLINTLPTDKNPSGYIISNAEDLLNLFDADFGVIAIGNEAKILGPLSASQEVLGCTEYLRLKKFQRVVTSSDVAKDFPDMVLPKGLEVIAGLLLVPLSNSGIDFITFLRKAQTRHVNWAGKPFKEGREKEAVLEPRKSFKVWSETVTGTCRAWKDEELETASVLCLVYGKFISVWRQREQAMQYNQLNKLLLSNASHEVRTPLNHIINYLELALDGNLDGDTRDHLSKSHMASKSLLFVINDLLDLTRHEQGNKLFLQEPFDLSSAVREAVEMHEMEARRRKIEFITTTTPEVCMVLGDKNRLRQVVTQTVTNSVKHTTEGQITVEMRKRDASEMSTELPDECDMEVEIVISDTGTGITREKLESIFREFEQVESVIADPSSGDRDVQDESAAADDLDMIAAQDSAAKEPGGALGLGLAIVARIIRNLGGQLRVDSTVGEGSRFTYYIPFHSAPPEYHQGSSTGVTQMGRTSSRGSGASGASSGQSEINSLVEAISTSHLDEPGMTSPGASTGLRRSSLDTHAHRGPSSATVRRPQVHRGTSSADSGVRQIEGSVVPLRSVKVDPHSLDSAARHVAKDASSSNRGPSGASALAAMPPHVAPPPDASSASSSPASPAMAQTEQRAAPPGTVDIAQVNATAAKKSPGITPNSDRSAGTLGGGTRGASSRRRAAVNKVRISPPISSPKATLPPLRVLVVEDDPINRMILKKRLSMDKHEVLLAVNGEEGVRLFEKEGDRIDLCLMDLQMPICNGQDACKRIRAFERQRTDANALAGRPASHILNGRVPIVAVSATLTFSMRQEMIDIGMDGWVLKPIDFARLHSLIKCVTHLEHRQTEMWKPSRAWEKGGWLAQPPTRTAPDNTPR